jgi:Flp pilus assembly protein TadD
MSRAERRRQEKRKQTADPSPQALELKRLLDEAVFHHRAGHFAQAEPLYQRILQVDPDHAEALHLLGLMAYQVGKLDQAGDLISRAIHSDSTKAPYFYNLGIVLQRLGRFHEAVTAYQQAVRLHPGYVEAHCNLGNVLKEQGKLEEAVAAYRKALAISPDYVDAHNNLGVVLEERGRYDEAVASYERALRLNPKHAEAHSNLGNALKELDRLDEAVASFDRALDLKPDYAKGHYNLAFAYLWQGRLDHAHASFMRSAELKQNHGRPVSGQSVYQSRIRHEAEQIRYLFARGLLPHDQAGYLAALDRVEQGAVRDLNRASRIAVTGETMREIAPSFNRIVYHAEAPPLPKGALNPALDVAAIEARYNTSQPEIMYVDHLLNDEALAGLRRFCLESTIWKKDYENGYLGAFLGDGFSSPLLLQISEELRLRFPGIFKDHRLRQAWAFKYDSRLRGLNIHADAAAVNVNFWITPDEANLDPDHGGLVVWDKEAPKEWNFREYNNTVMEPKIREFLKSSRAQAVTVPYRHNRAVIFNSDLFHETDRIAFEGGYENRRVNITLLYGKRFA